MATVTLREKDVRAQSGITPGLSATVRRGIPRAVSLIEALISEANERAPLPFTNPSGALT